MSRPLLLAALAVAGCAAAHPAPLAAPQLAPIARARYTMDVALDPARHELRVTGTVVVPSPGAAISLALMASATGVELTSTPAGTWSSSPPPADPAAGKIEHTLALAAPAAEVTIRFAYVSHQETGFVYHIADDALLAGGPNTAWYPQLADKAVGTVTLHYPARYRMVAGGRAVDRDAAGTRTTTVTYVQPSTFSFVAAELREHAQAGVVPMRALVVHDRPGLAAYLDGCARVLAVLSREFGPYAYDGFALVELPDAVTEAAGFWGASFEGFMIASSSNLDAPFNLAYFGHELGHQWWGNSVTLAGDAGGMLTNEGLAQYGSLRAVEELEGAAAAEAYRRRGYPGYNDDQSGLGYLRYAAAGLDLPLAAPVGDRGALMHQLANSKGLLAIDHLARVIGRDRLRAALHEATRRYAFRALAWSELRAIVEAHAGRGLGTVFAQWFERTGAPDWAVAWTPAGRTARGAIVQLGAPYQLEVEVALIGAHATAIRKVAIDGARTELALDAPFDVERIELDPRFEILHWTPAYRAEAEAFADCTRAYAKRAEGDAAAAGALFVAGLARAPAPTPAADPYGVRFMLEAGYGRVLQRQGELAAARDHFTAALAAPVRPAEQLPRVYLHLAEIAAHDHDRDAVLRYARAAIDAEAATGHALGIAAEVAPLVAGAT